MSRVGVFASPDEAREFKQLLLQLRAAGYALQGGAKRQPVIEAPRDIVVFNSSGEEIPPFAVMQCIGAQDDVIEVDKPADRYGVNGAYLINGDKEIAIDGRGVGYENGAVLVHTDGSADTALQRLSPEVDEWYAIRNPAGNMIYLGDSTVRASGDIVYAVIDGFPQVIHAKAGVTGVTAASGSSPRAMGSGVCDLYESDSSGSLTSADMEITLYNFSATAVTSSRFVLASRNEKGLWVVVAEDCTT